MKKANRTNLSAITYLLSGLLLLGHAVAAEAPSNDGAALSTPVANSSTANEHAGSQPVSPQYEQVQHRLARGWNTWDVHSVTTHVLLPEGLAIRIGLEHNSTEGGDAFLPDALIGRLTPGAEQVFPGEHSWDGSSTDLRVSWKGHNWRIQSARDGDDLVLLATPLPSKPISALPPTIVFSVNFLWNRPGTTLKHPDYIETRGASGTVPIYCTCTRSTRVAGANQDTGNLNLPMAGPYFSTDFTQPVGISSGKPLTLAEIESLIDRQHRLYQQSVSAAGNAGPIVDAIETTLGWDTIFEPQQRRVVSPVSRVWSVRWAGYVIFDWDTFFAATMASIGSRDLAYADAIETLRESTRQGFVPNYARTGGWKSSDRSEPPVGSITVLGLYQKFHDRWFLQEAFQPLVQWNRWWAAHRDIQGYLTWGSDGENQPANLDDKTRGTRAGAILESGLDNSPMYDDTSYNSQSHVLEFADVGLMSMYIADCDALATIADALDKSEEARVLRERSARYRAKLSTLWSSEDGIFLNRNLNTGEFSHRLSPTNFYPLLAKAVTPAQATLMIQKHLLNLNEFWGQWVIPSIARNDPAFHDQNYWRGRIWGPMNYLVYLGLRNYDHPKSRHEFAQKSFDLFLKEWAEKGHVHENYNAMSGTGDDVTSSDRFYHWGALLGYIQYMEQTQPATPARPDTSDKMGLEMMHRTAVNLQK